jgi:hypothetical protein
MANVTRIDVRLKTGSRGGAGTDGDVYIGVGGREFYIDTSYDDFETGSDRTYVLGQGANIKHATYNDPNQPPIQDTDVDRFPVYLRFEPKGDNADWNIEFISVVVNPGPQEKRFERLAGGGALHLWLGQKYGKFLYLG